MRWVRLAIGVTNLALLVALLFLLSANGASAIVPGAWEYKDLIAILLTAVSVIITFIGFIVAVAAIWGFQTLKGMAEEKAIETSKLGSSAYLSSDAFKADLAEQIKAAMQTAAREAVQDALTSVIVPADVAPEHQVGDEKWQD
jgi:uncharacterized membrane protein YcjF (UPF0283 family)